VTVQRPLLPLADDVLSFRAGKSLNILAMLVDEKWQSSIDIQFFQITVCDIMTAPIRNSIELYAMRELHFVLLDELLEFICSLDLALEVPRGFLLSIPDSLVVNKFVGLGSYVL
jgi:hypothetical protein